MEYAFVELVRDIGSWLLAGILIAGTITYLVPESFVLAAGRYEWASLLAMLLFAVPLYVCATASTPVAAALVLKGLSPGAALVFLLAGPATNAATITVLTKTLGRWATTVYVLIISVCSVLFGWLVNRLYQLEQLSTSTWLASFGERTDPLLPVLASILLLALIAVSYLLPRFRERPSRSPAAQMPADKRLL